MSWARPLRLNGVLTAYLVKHWRNDTLPSSGQTKRLSNTTLSHTVTGLRANTAYSVEVSAETRAGTGTSKNLVATTTQSPGKLPALLLLINTSDFMNGYSGFRLSVKRSQLSRSLSQHAFSQTERCHCRLAMSVILPRNAINSTATTETVKRST